ncbi:hypothetical protein Tsubulata_044316 [Turnera subulata]|uniref:SET domain-containing protein n=1 Tax=Turnera subulata TaxID=218843 RepID=A0A9Q0JQ18_9ROSI|nr:hypothetical protein Tsubulata_044316 [Turnera subulata]
MSQQQQLNKRNKTQSHPFLRFAGLILPWLTPPELAAVSSTCKTLHRISKSVALRRSLDAARSLERRPIPFHNPLPGDATTAQYANFLYTPSQLLPSQSPTRQPWGLHSPGQLGRDLASQSDRISPHQGKSGCGCDCEGCGEEESGEIFCGVEEEMETGILSECGPSCGCGLECGNRLTQRGVSVGLKIVRDVRKGWGLFADQLIPQGHFVCEYAGELLTTEESRRRQEIYDGHMTGGRSSSALLVVREHLPSGKACLRINIDATRVGNIARFINHSCDGGNLSSVLVRNTGSLIPRLCFFASKDIEEGEELTFSYGEIRVRANGMPCFCGSSCCLGTLPSEHT